MLLLLSLLLLLLQVARRYFLSTTSLEAMLELRRQFAQLLVEAHLICHSHPHPQQATTPGTQQSSSSSKWVFWADDPSHPCNRFCSQSDMLRAALVAGLSPQVALSLSTAAGLHSKPGWIDNRGQQVRG